MSRIWGIVKGVGFWIRDHKGLTITIGVVVFIIGLFVTANIYQAHKQKSLQAQTEMHSKSDSNKMSEYDREQQQLIQKYGKPKKGFRWTDDGQLMAIGSIGKTPEDVAYTYVRSLSTLDFANAQRYSYKTQTVKTYESFFDSDEDFSYNTDFKQGMYKQVLLSMKPIKITDMTSFADFKQVVTMQIEMLDLTNKDFWLPDKDKLFNELKKYQVTEKDTTKMKDFLYNYVLQYYSSPKAKTRLVNVNFVLEQTMDNAWLVTNDSELDAIAQYQDGATVVDQVLDDFDTWLSQQDVSSDSGNTDLGTSNNADEVSPSQDGGSFDQPKGSPSGNQSSSFSTDGGSFDQPKGNPSGNQSISSSTDDGSFDGN